MTTPWTLVRIKAEVLRLMAEHANLPSRGWDGQRERAILHHKIDELLDRYALESLLWAESIPRAIDTA